MKVGTNASEITAEARRYYILPGREIEADRDNGNSSDLVR